MPTVHLMSRVWPSRRPGDRLELLRTERSASAYLVTRAEPQDRQRVFALPDRDGRVCLGGGVDCDVHIEWDGTLGAPHTAFDRIAGQWVLRPADGHRVRVNGAWVDAATPLDDGDIVHVGATRLLFRDLARARRADGTLAAGRRTGRRISITDTQRRVIIALARPLFASPPSDAPAPNRAIAAELGVTVAAVKKHLNVLVQAFGLQDVPQRDKRRRLVAEAQTTGMIGLRDFRALRH